jgi:hypothetical protein
LNYYSFLQFDILRKHDFISNSLNFKTLYCRRHIDALFLIDVFKGKINCHSITDTVGIRVSARQIRESSICNVNSAQGHWSTARRVTAGNDVQIFGHVQQKQCLFEDTFLTQESVYIDYMYLVFFSLVFV